MAMGYTALVLSTSSIHLIRPDAIFCVTKIKNWSVGWIKGSPIYRWILDTRRHWRETRRYILDKTTGDRLASYTLSRQFVGFLVWCSSPSGPDQHQTTNAVNIDRRASELGVKLTDFLSFRRRREHVRDTDKERVRQRVRGRASIHVEDPKCIHMHCSIIDRRRRSPSSWVYL